MSRLREWKSVQIVYLLKQSWLEWYQSRAFEHGAALAFYAIFSIAPVIVLAFTAASSSSRQRGGAGLVDSGDRKHRRPDRGRTPSKPLPSTRTGAAQMSRRRC